ncbi:MAG: ATP-binding cassette domain-containing protein [Myxococcales bacterium]|nr:ATP-binding cassette domain-containing protein [Myxococcales bacterium]MCB9708967.1 ATP-binding cassette domain-containing protein [Myxococcales bacterium]
MIEAINLSKHYGTVRAVDHVSFQVRKGEVLGFLGPNGAGKTTTMKILTCFIAPSSGTAKVNGLDVFDDSIGVRRAIGYLPEHTPLYSDMMVYEYLSFVAQMRALSNEAAAKAIKRVVEQTGLGEVVGRPIRVLSRGYRQRVGLAQAMIHEPAVLILDEPLSGLDPNQASEIRELIKEIGKERTVVLSTHNLAEVQLTCERVLIIARGKIVADDSTEDLKNRAGHARFSVTVLTEGADSTRQQARAILDNVEHVSRVIAHPEHEGRTRFEVIPTGAHDLSAALFRAAVSGNIVLTELSRQGQDLEEVFRQLTLHQEPLTNNSVTATKAA